MRTKTEIETEISALKALKPVGPFKRKTTESIALAIEELETGYDDTAGEYNELSDNDRDVIQSTRQWKEGAAEEKTSESFGGLVKT